MVRFMFWMLFASSLGFAKLMALVFILGAGDYGYYVAIFGLGTLAGAVGSFGLIERATKHYPRLCAEGKYSEVIQDSESVLVKLIIRYLGLACVGMVFVNIAEFSFGLFELAYVSVLGLGTSCLALYASLYRAYGSKLALQTFSLIRSITAFTAVLALGAFYDWQGAIAGDIGAAIFTSIYSHISLKKLLLSSDGKQEKREIEKVDEPSVGHQKLYLGNMLTGSVSMSDKALVGMALGAASAGSYGVVMLLPQISQILVNVVSQYIGPLVIKFAHVNHKDETRISDISLQGFLLSILVFVGAVLIVLAREFDFVNDVFLKYSISNLSVFLAAIIASGQIYSLIEFHLIAYDYEMAILIASAVGFFIFITFFLVCYFFDFSIEYFVASMALARWGQVVILSFYLKRLRRKLGY